MFAILATKPLNDGTQGFRYNFLGMKGLVRKRKFKSRGWFKLQRQGSMHGLHLGRITIYREHAANKKTKRILHHFAG